MPAPSTRPLRADAQRNRDRLLHVAVTALSEDGDVALETIAKRAGVGIGTLYRHFPTREALVEEAYRGELDRLCDAAAELLADRPAEAALREWMDRYVDYMAAKRGMAEALRALIAGGGNPFAHSRERMIAAVTLLLEAGAAAGTVRSDIEPADVFLSLSGMVVIAGEHGRRDQIGRMLDLLMDGLRRR